MSNYLFSAYKDPAKIKVSKRRKIKSAVRDKFKSMSKTDVAKQAGSTAIDGAGAVGTGASIAAMTGVSTAFVAAATGPLAGSILGLVGIVLLAKGTYSNRERAHARLANYVWTYIDDERPRMPLDDDAKAAALGLMLDGQAQVQGQADKLSSSEAKFNTFCQEYSKLARVHEFFAVQRTTKAQFDLLPHLFKADEKRENLLDAAMGRNGAVFEYMRRLVHAGNYMQAANIFAKVMNQDNSELKDFKKGCKARRTRAMLSQFSDLVRKHDKIMVQADRVAMSPHPR